MTIPHGVSLVGAALILSAVGVASFVAAEHYHFSETGLLLAWISLGFMVSVGWDYRKGFRSLSFTIFFVVWLLLNFALFALTAVFLSWLYWVALLPLQLWAGCLFAARVLGVRPESKSWRTGGPGGKEVHR
jgi:hypothetical protein